MSLAQPTISQHLKELKNVGIIKGTAEGKAICYCLSPEKTENYFGGISKELKNKCC